MKQGTPSFAPSQRAQIIRHIAALSQHSRIAEVARIAGSPVRLNATACMAQHFPKTLRTLYRGCGAKTFYWFTNNDAAVPPQVRHRSSGSGYLMGCTREGEPMPATPYLPRRAPATTF